MAKIASNRNSWNELTERIYADHLGELNLDISQPFFEANKDIFGSVDFGQEYDADWNWVPKTVGVAGLLGSGAYLLKKLAERKNLVSRTEGKGIPGKNKSNRKKK